MKRILSLLLALTVLAGVSAISVSANVTEQNETVYFYNDFSTSDSTDKLESIGTVVGETDVENSVFKLSKGTYKLNNTSKTGGNGYVSVPYEEGEKPNIVLEYKITPHDLKGNYYNANNRFLYTNTHSIDAVFIGGTAIDALSTTANTATGDISLIKEATNDKTYIVKIVYSATENIRTIYINGKCLGTFDNSVTGEKAWSEDTLGKFHFAFVKNKQAASSEPLYIDYVKVYKAEANMIKVDLSNNGANLPTGTKDTLWIPENESVSLKVSAEEGKTYSIAINNEVYIDSFNNELSYQTPALKEGDAISITTADAETEFASYTKPYVFQYVREDGAKAAVVLGRMVEVEGYTSNSFGIFFSLEDENVTEDKENVEPVLVRDKTKVVDGNYAIELYSDKLESGMEIFYKSYAYYTNDADEEDIRKAFGKVESIVIE